MTGKVLLHPTACGWLKLVLGMINRIVLFGQDKGMNKYDALDHTRSCSSAGK
jgi:hypothetical protein